MSLFLIYFPLLCVSSTTEKLGLVLFIVFHYLATPSFIINNKQTTTTMPIHRPPAPRHVTQEEVVCPLCCEDLDITDRQFYPCKCGYQVCMWCWHRIKESETGLCPACRTPYGDNPHAFSAVDVEEVLKANKEKEAAAKRERERHRQQQQAVAAAVNPTDAEAVLTSLSGNRSVGRMDAPKDRSQLVGMRVIRRNLVYAVGLPPGIANEETLRKPEYFGQYGKIAKIVLNRGTPAQGRPSTSSAYVTFAYKVSENTPCVLGNYLCVSHKNTNAGAHCLTHTHTHTLTCLYGFFFFFFRRTRWPVSWRWTAFPLTDGIFEHRTVHPSTALHI